MKPHELRRAMVAYLTWMATLTLGLILAMTRALPLKLALLEAPNLNILLVQTEIFFLLLVWPLFIPAMAGHLTRRRDRCAQLLGHAAVLMLLSFPLALVTHFVARTDLSTMGAGRLLAAAAALFVVGVFGLGPAGNERLSRGYFLSALVLTGLLPYASFVMTRATDTGVLTWFSPLWSATQLNAAPAMPLTTSAIFGGVGAAMVATAWVRSPIVREPAAS